MAASSLGNRSLPLPGCNKPSGAARVALRDRLISRLYKTRKEKARSDRGFKIGNASMVPERDEAEEGNPIETEYSSVPLVQAHEQL